MREIKFRGLTKSGKWAIGFYTRFLYETESGEYPEDALGHFILPIRVDGGIEFQREEDLFIDVDPETVGQFTGLLDKHGTEIYEGDILKLFYGHQSWICDPFEVVFMNGAFAMKKPDKRGSTSFAVYLSDCLKEGLITDGSDDSFLFEVIGNVHQNPELLK